MTAANPKKSQSVKGLPRGRPFAPGNKSNPSGRPKKTEEERTLEQMCREKTPEALATILKIMQEGENERNQLAAAQLIIERGHGKPRQEVTGLGGDAIQHAMSIAVSFVAPAK